MLPGSVPLAELVPELARSVGLLDAATVYGGYRLVTRDGRELDALAAVDRDLDRYSFAGGASVYPFAWSVLLAAHAEDLGGVVTTMCIHEEPGREGAARRTGGDGVGCGDRTRLSSAIELASCAT